MNETEPNDTILGMAARRAYPDAVHIGVCTWRVDGDVETVAVWTAPAGAPGERPWTRVAYGASRIELLQQLKSRWPKRRQKRNNSRLKVVE